MNVENKNKLKISKKEMKEAKRKERSEREGKKGGESKGMERQSEKARGRK